MLLDLTHNTRGVRSLLFCLDSYIEDSCTNRDTFDKSKIYLARKVRKKLVDSERIILHSRDLNNSDSKLELNEIETAFILQMFLRYYP